MPDASLVEIPAFQHRVRVTIPDDVDEKLRLLSATTPLLGRHRTIGVWIRILIAQECPSTNEALTE